MDIKISISEDSDRKALCLKTYKSIISGEMHLLNLSKFRIGMGNFGNTTELQEQLSNTWKSLAPPKSNRCHSTDGSSNEVIIFAILNYVISASGIVLNTIQIYSLSKQKKLKCHDSFLLSLSVAELLRLLVEVIHMTIHLHGAHSRIIGDLIKTVLMTVLFISIFNLLAITLDRYTAVTSPLKYRVKVTKRRVCLSCIAIWLLPVVITSAISAASFLVNSGDSKYDTKITHSFIIVSGFLLIILYTKIMGKVKSSQKSLPAGNLNKGKLNCRTKKTVQMSGLICIIFILFNFPLAIIALVGVCTKWPVLLQLISCSLDSVVYFWMTQRRKKQKLRKDKIETINFWTKWMCR